MKFLVAISGTLLHYKKCCIFQCSYDLGIMRTGEKLRYYVDKGNVWNGCLSSDFRIYYLQYIGMDGVIHLYVVL